MVGVVISPLSGPLVRGRESPTQVVSTLLLGILPGIGSPATSQRSPLLLCDLIGHGKPKVSKCADCLDHDVRVSFLDLPEAYARSLLNRDRLDLLLLPFGLPGRLRSFWTTTTQDTPRGVCCGEKGVLRAPVCPLGPETGRRQESTLLG